MISFISKFKHLKKIKIISIIHFINNFININQIIDNLKETHKINEDITKMQLISLQIVYSNFILNGN